MTLLGKIEEIKEPKTNQSLIWWKCQKRNKGDDFIVSSMLWSTLWHLRSDDDLWVLNILDLGLNQIQYSNWFVGDSWLVLSLLLAIDLLWSCAATTLPPNIKYKSIKYQFMTRWWFLLFSLLSWPINLTILFLHFGGRNSLKNFRESFSVNFYFWSFLFE